MANGLSPNSDDTGLDDQQSNVEIHKVDLNRSQISRFIWFTIGFMIMCVGLVGIVIPGLPTTPLMILAAACYAKSSQKFYDWIINNKMFGHHVKNYREGKGIPSKSKRFIIPTIWIFVLFAVFYGIPERLIYAKVATLILALIGTIFIIKIPNLQE
tara:strand:+ start:10504 stop:10971 length:468 start_codon:yes stop_codon:yes gene_type:complete